MHGYEIEYVFGLPLRVPQQYDSSQLASEQLFSSKIMELWGRFARTGYLLPISLFIYINF